jgi:hypothetical protein
MKQHPHLTHVVFSLLVAAAAAACGTSGDELFGGGTDGAATSGAGGASSSASSSGTEDVSSSTTTSATSGPASSSAEASASASTGSGPAAMLDCNGQTCPQGGQSGCCWDNYGLNGGPQAQCVNHTEQCDTTLHDGPKGAETLIQCETPDQCPNGQICCGHREYTMFGSYYTEVSCQASCEWPNVNLCDASDPSFVCPVVDNNGFQTQTTCKASTLLPMGYTVCGL